MEKWMERFGWSGGWNIDGGRLFRFHSSVLEEEEEEEA